MAGDGKYQKLFELCATGDRIALSDYIITSGCSPSAYDARDSAGKTALHIACRHGHLFIVRSLIEIFDCDLMVRDNNRALPLHDACLYGSLAVVDYLISLVNPSDISTTIRLSDAEGNNLLHKACQSGSVATVRYLLQNVCFPKKSTSPNLNLYLDCLASYDVASESKISACDFSLLTGCILSLNLHGDTPMLVACRHGHLNILKVFKAFIPFNEFLKALFVTAVKCNNSSIVSFLGDIQKHHPLDFCSEAITIHSPDKVKLQKFTQHAFYDDDWFQGDVLLCNECGASLSANSIPKFDFQSSTGVCPECNYDTHKYNSGYAVNCISCSLTFSSTTLIGTKCPLCSSSNLALVDDIAKSLQIHRSAVSYSVLQQEPSQAAALCGNLQLYQQAQLIFSSTKTDILHAACISDNVELVTHIMKTMKFEVNALDKNGNTPLHVACEWGSLKVFEFLLTFSNLQTAAMNNTGDSPLSLACKYNRTAFCIRLLDSSSDCCSAFKEGKETPLQLACSNSNLDIVKDIIKKSDTSPINIEDENGDTPIFNACRCGNLEIIKLLIVNGSNPLYLNRKTKETPVHIASRMGRPDVIEVLCENTNCDSLQTNIYGASPIQLAVESRSIKTLKTLINLWPADINNTINKNKTTLAHYATQVEEIDLIKALLQHSVNWNAQDSDGNTALHLACMKNNTQIVSAIVGNCSITVQNSKLETPVHIATVKGNISVLSMLLNGFSGSLDGYRNESGETVLHSACRQCSTDSASSDIVSLILKYCCVTTLNIFQQTPMHLACKTKKVTLVKHLLDKFPASENLKNLVDNAKDSVLHIAVQTGCLDIATLLSEQVSPTCVNAVGETPIHQACERGYLEIAQMLITKSHKIILSSKGNSYLHSACRGKSLEVAKFLIVESGLDYSKLLAINNEGSTPLHIACSLGTVETVSFLLPYTNNDMHKPNTIGLTPFCLLLKKNHTDAIKHLLSSEPDYQNMWCSSDHPMLHCIVCFSNISDLLNLIQFVVDGKYSDPLQCDNKGNTVLHSFIEQLGRWGYVPFGGEIWDYLISIPEIEINKQNQNGDTPLHLLCKLVAERPYHSHDMREIIKKLLVHAESSIQESLRSKNKQGKTPIQLANKQVIRMLIPYGGNPTDVYYEFRPILDRFKSKHPLHPSMKIIVVGNSTAGKTTLVNTIKNSKLDSPVPVVSVDEPTAGVKTSEHKSRDLGRVTFHDFAGQPEFESSNSAFLENSVSLEQPPIFLLLVDISKGAPLLEKHTRYWFNYIQNHSPRQLETPPHVIVIGSHCDLVDTNLHAGIRKCIQVTVSSIKSSNFHVIGPYLLDCRKVDKSLKKLSKMLAKSCSSLRKTVDMDIRCHILFAFLSTWFPGKSAVRFHDIQDKIKSQTQSTESSYYSSYAGYNDTILDSYSSYTSEDILLPFTKDTLIDLLKSLHAGGHVLLLNPENAEECWVVMDNDVLFERVNGTLFAPPSFKGPKLSTNTGVLSEEMLSSHFGREIETDLITAFAVYSEICRRIEDSETLKLIENACLAREFIGTDSISESFDDGDESSSQIASDQDDEDLLEDNHSVATAEQLKPYYFFPGLVKCERPKDVWPDMNGTSYNFGWYLLCNQNNFLDPRFLYVLLLRLTFNFATATEAVSQLVRQCNIWKNGIYWGTTSGVQVLVEVIEQNTAVLLLVRCLRDFEMEGVKLRSDVIRKILDTKEQFCPNAEVTEYVLNRCTHYPQELDLQQRIPVTDIAQSFANASPCVLDSGHKPQVLKSLLFFDPYFEIGGSLIKQLWSEAKSDEEISGTFLFELSEAQQMFTQQVSKLLGLPQREFDSYKAKWEAEPTNLLFHIYEAWKSKQDYSSFQSLREVFNSGSIFCGRNPLVSKTYVCLHI